MGLKFTLVLGLVAFILTSFATVLHLAGFFIAKWRVIREGNRDIIEGLWKTEICVQGHCSNHGTFGKINGGEEWFFICKLFEAFAVILCLVSVLLHLLFFCCKKPIIRSSAIYMMGSAGLFILMGVSIFIAKYQETQVQNRNTNVEITLHYPVGLCLSAGVIAIAAAVLTSAATVMLERES